MYFLNNTGMDKSTGTNPIINHKTRGRSSHIKKNLSRDTSMSSTCSSIIYHERVAMNNSMDVNSDLPVESPALSYETEQEKVLRFSKATETTSNMRPQGGNNETSSIQANHGGHVSFNKTCGEAPCDDNNNAINIQIPYDPNAPTEPELWSRNFHSISLHSSIKQITLNIKDLLNFMARYITNKKVNWKSANNLKDFDGIGNVVWNFILSVYQSGWDSLYTDNKSKTLREKISSRFSPRIIPSLTQKSNKLVPKPTLASIDKIPQPLPLPAKTAKEVNVISKYFQNKKSLNDNKSKEDLKTTKSYAQASKAPVNMAKVLKIKKVFPALNMEKINQVNNIVKETVKSKPKIQMTTKGPSRKQIIIIPMSKENVDSFIKNSSLYVSNINRQFCNAKSEILVNYIRAEPLGITVVTNKVSQPSDLMLID